jgi:hypothetical protein
VLTLPANKVVAIPVGTKKVKTAALLNGNVKLKFKQDEINIIIRLENTSAESLDTVAKLTF